ncbi:unnamed protein product [Oncorhynchus mykiss]|uniref:RRM domain-containing protein n=1 Tax=Oncorhynchus mykiss TaxID=8022 RepID=A0A060X6H1_ONCMY|nr:unnamed protein product [Oncorhynchus mykiss]
MFNCPGGYEQRIQFGKLTKAFRVSPSLVSKDVLYTVCNPIGSVMRIVIFKRNGIQAMVEYPFCLAAKAALNGADIYAGCCTLKIEYARPTRLNVIRNDNESWDYTKPYLVRRDLQSTKPTQDRPTARPSPSNTLSHPSLTSLHLPPMGIEGERGKKRDGRQADPAQQHASIFTQTSRERKRDYSFILTSCNLNINTPRTTRQQRQAILGEHPSSYGDNGYGSHCPLLPLPGNSRYKLSSHDIPEVVAYPLPQSSSYNHGSSSVAMVSGLHPAKMNCTRIFNLFCLYGNIEKVKFMKSVPGTALVEMGDEYAVDRAITHLNSIKVFGKRLNVCVSKQHAVIPSQVFELEDGSSSYKDFAMTRNNRFTSQGQASKNIIQPPSCVLHYYNVPPCISEDQLLRLCSEHDVPGFTKFKMFDAKPSSKTISGLLEFDSKTHAVEVLTVLNHYQIRIPNGSNPYTLKLCFSTSSHL